MLHIGITGGMGSGKTTVCKIFEHLNVPIYYADERAKQLVAAELKETIQQAFGKDIYDGSELNRNLLAQRAFSSKEKTDQLNSIVHPAVAKDYLNWKAKQVGPYTLKEAALLIEAGSYKELDALILVKAPLEIRIQRVIKRDSTTRELVMQRINKQLPEEQKEPFANYFIVNDGQQSLINQVLNIHQKILKIEKE